MTTNINFTNLVNIDDATSLDRIYWLVEERGLSLGLLQAEQEERIGVKRIREYCEHRLEELAEKGQKAKESYYKRIILEEKAKYWRSDISKPFVIGEGREVQYNWLHDKWFEDNSYVWKCEIEYLRIQYKETKENLDKFIEKTSREIKEKAEDKITFEEYVARGEYGKEEEVMDLGFNQIHYDGCRRNGQNLLRDIKYHMAIGTMDEVHENFISRVKNSIARREILAEEYHKCMAYLYKFSGFTDKMKESIEKAQAKERPIYSPKSDVVVNAYSMSIEDAIDLKRQAERISETHHISLEEAIISLMEEDTSDSTFFAGEATEDSVDDVMNDLSKELRFDLFIPAPIVEYRNPGASTEDMDI